MRADPAPTKKPLRVAAVRPTPEPIPAPDDDLSQAAQDEGIDAAFLGFVAEIPERRLNGLVAALTHPASDGQVDVDGGDEAVWRRAFPWLHAYADDQVRVLIRWAAAKAGAVVIEGSP